MEWVKVSELHVATLLFFVVFISFSFVLHYVKSIFPYSVRMWENVDQNNSEYEHFLGSVA